MSELGGLSPEESPPKERPSHAGKVGVKGPNPARKFSPEGPIDGVFFVGFSGFPLPWGLVRTERVGAPTSNQKTVAGDCCRLLPSAALALLLTAIPGGAQEAVNPEHLQATPRQALTAEATYLGSPSKH